MILIEFSCRIQFSYHIDLVLGACKKWGEKCTQGTKNPNCCGSMICGDDPSNPIPHRYGRDGICMDEGKCKNINHFFSIDVLKFHAKIVILNCNSIIFQLQIQ